MKIILSKPHIYSYNLNNKIAKLFNDSNLEADQLISILLNHFNNFPWSKYVVGINYSNINKNFVGCKAGEIINFCELSIDSHEEFEEYWNRFKKLKLFI